MHRTSGEKKSTVAQEGKFTQPVNKGRCPGKVGVYREAGHMCRYI